MPATLAELVSSDRVEFDELHKRYGSVLQMVDVLIGVVPNCDMYLEIWPTGFRTYNLMVPNFLNLPVMLIGRGAPKDLVGLGMYVSSRAASCAYCSAHTCSFALRRGSSADAITGADRTDSEQAVAVIAEALSTVPHTYYPKLNDDLVELLGASDAEWVVMGVAMMGFLNKFMDAMGVELEAEAVNDVADLIEPTGWSVGQHDWAGIDRAEESAPPATDSLGTFLQVGRNARGAVKLDRQWMQGIPKDAEALRTHVKDTCGYDEQLLTAMNHTKPRRALGAMLRDNLDPEASELGIGVKALTGLVFATLMNNEYLIAQSRSLASQYGIEEATIDAAAAYQLGDDTGAFDEVTGAALSVAAAISPSPAVVEADVVERAATSLSSAQTVEVAVWISVSQLLHRLSLYYQIAN